MVVGVFGPAYDQFVREPWFAIAPEFAKEGEEVQLVTVDVRSEIELLSGSSRKPVGVWRCVF